MTENNDPTPSEDISSREKTSDQEVLSSHEHESMETRTYPMSVVVAAAAVTGLLGATLGFTASLASMGISHHSKHHSQYGPGPNAWMHPPGWGEGPGKPGDRVRDGLCVQDGKVSPLCESKDDPDTPVPTPPWMGGQQPMPQPMPSASQDESEEPLIENPPIIDPQAEQLAKYITRERPTLEEATKLALEQGLTVRVVMEDGVGGPMTMDYRFDRINFVVEDGLVVKADIG